MIARIWRAFMRAGGLKTWAIIGAAVALTGFGGWHTWIVWKGPWPADRAPQQLDILAWGLWGALVLIGVIIVALTGLGVVANVSKDGVNLNVGDDDRETGL